MAIVDSRNRVHYRQVQVGRDLGPEVEILAGLRAGESVVSNTPDTLEEGSAIRRVAGGVK